MAINSTLHPRNQKKIKYIKRQSAANKGPPLHASDRPGMGVKRGTFLHPAKDIKRPETDGSA
jgi:hypothetical protein